jgi:hypothetical protein
MDMYLVIHVYFYIVKMAEETLKFCNKCHLNKPLTQFHIKNREFYIDYASMCKTCTSIYRKERSLKLKEYKITGILRQPINNYREVKGAIGNLTEEQFKTACEMVQNNCSIYKLAKFIDCCQATAKKYVEQGLFNNP